MTTMIAQSPGLICSVAPKGLKPIVALESKNASKDAGATVNRAILPENYPTPCPDFVNPRKRQNLWHDSVDFALCRRADQN
jgi:hypothetical protein